MPKYVRKRTGELEPFDKNRIAKAVFKASKAVGNDSEKFALQIAEQVEDKLNKKFTEEGTVTTEEIQDTVERTLMEGNYYRIAKSYILYRDQHRELREIATALNGIELIEQYLDRADWTIYENANRTFCLQGLNNYISSEFSRLYWLNRVYPNEIRRAHVEGDIHIHNLDLISPYCVGWDLYDLLTVGFRGVRGKISCTPPKHLRSALGQLVNFLYTLQLHSAGAQAVSNLDTLLAPFVAVDNLSYKEVKQCIQEFIFNLNVPTRTSGEVPFTNISLDIGDIPSAYRELPVVIGGTTNGNSYSDYIDESKLITKALFEVMSEGDAENRVFTFPIPTISITKDFSWDDEVLNPMWEATAKYGLPYFQNFINSELKQDDIRSMCCHLSLNLKELKNKVGGYFGSDSLTGSIGNVTINMPRLGYYSKDETQFYEKLDKLLDLCMSSLEIKRKVLENMTEKGLYPYSRFYLRDVKAKSGKYWSNHFSTIGLVGMNECLLNMFGVDIASKEGIDFTCKVLRHMRDKLIEYQQQTGNLYNLEATPAEGCSYRLALLDQKKLKDSYFANGKGKSTIDPFYTGSTFLPVNYTDDVFEALEKQEPLQVLYTGGTVFHMFIGERISNIEALKQLIHKSFSTFRVPYVTVTPTFSICSIHGYLGGEHQYCPSCNNKCEVYSRVVGYLRPIDDWHKGKQAEYKLRKTFKVQ